MSWGLLTSEQLEILRKKCNPGETEIMSQQEFNEQVSILEQYRHSSNDVDQQIAICAALKLTRHNIAVMKKIEQITEELNKRN